MQTIIIKKWIEPYIILETIKKFYTYSDVNFDASTKSDEKNKFLKKLEQTKNSVGLYMKNVNKYYFFTSDDSIDLKNILFDKFNFSDDDIVISNPEEMFNMVDLGKAETGIIIQ